MAKLEKSEEFYRKKELTEQNELPMLTEINDRLNKPLVEIFMETCDPMVKPVIGLVPPLDGPQNELWISPSDILVGKLRLKPPLTNTYIKALTHQGIMNIGKSIEDKFFEEFAAEKKKVLQKNDEMWQYIVEKEKQLAACKAQEDERKACEYRLQEMEKCLKDIHATEMAKLKNNMDLEKEFAVMKGKAEIQEQMNAALEVEVHKTVARLVELFANILKEQHENLHNHFKMHLLLEQNKLFQAIDRERTCCMENLRDTKEKLTCENVANLMYVMCNERRRCACEKKAMEIEYKLKLREMSDQINALTNQLKESQKSNDVKEKQILSRENALCEIIKQFQKFIYYVLQEIPTQAEYLLNIEKLMIFELTKTMVKMEPESFPDNLMTELSDGSCHDDSSSTECSSPSRSSWDLKICDYHDCENKYRIDTSAHTLSDKDDLPGFIFDEKIYVREDFRNMVSQGLEVSKSNEFWSYDVQDFTDAVQLQGTKKSKLKSTASSPSSSAKVRGSQRSVSFLTKEVLLRSHSYEKVDRTKQLDRPYEMKDYQKKDLSKKTDFKIKEKVSNLPFKDEFKQTTMGGIEEISLQEQIIIVSDTLQIKQSKQLHRAEKDTVSIHQAPLHIKISKQLPEKEKDNVSIQQSPPTPKLLNVKDSLEVLLKSKSSVKSWPRNSRRSSLADTRDSLTLYRSSDLNQEMKAVKNKKTISSFVLTRDSVELTKIKSQSPSSCNVSKSCEKPSSLKQTPAYSRLPSEGNLETEDDVDQFLKFLEFSLKRTYPEKKVSHKMSRVRISHIEIIQKHGEKPVTKQSVGFQTTPEIIRQDTPSNKVQDREKSTTHVPGRPENVCRVVGDPIGLDHLIQTKEEFTIKRMNSVMKILKKQPSLRNLFIG